MEPIQEIIENAFERRDSVTPAGAPAELHAAVDEALGRLDRGEARVPSPATATGRSTSG